VGRGADTSKSDDGSSPSVQTDAMVRTWRRCKDVSSLEFAQMLLEHQAVIHASSHVGEPPLIVGLEHGRIEVIRLLLTRGADLKCVNIWVGPPLSR
jgi:hypothetical protein